MSWQETNKEHDMGLGFVFSLSIDHLTIDL